MNIAIRKSILNGNLTMPNIPELRAQTKSYTYRMIEKMFEAMWYAYLRKGADTPISLPYWARRINNPKAMNIAIKVLSEHGWVFSSARPNNNWAETYLLEAKLLNYVSQEELDSVRSYHKFRQYQLKREELSTNPHISKIQGEIKEVGITAEGFTAEGNVPFQFDTIMLSKYRNQAIELVNKGIDKTIQQYPELANDHANYGEIAKLIVDNYIIANETYTSGQNTTDPRGRNNAGYLNKIGNPVGFKIMRSMLVIPEEHRNKATREGVNNIYLFIAELHGFKNGTESQKWLYGCRKYIERSFLDVELDDLFENVWLERLYDELDQFKNNPNHRWSTPIEIDMSASVLGYIGLLLNHKPFLERCNMIGELLTDAWEHPIITNRKQFKTIMRQCYGSMLTPAEMWREMDIEFTREEELAFTRELQSGDIAVANAFKNFIIANCDPKPEMDVVVGDRTIKTFCNRFHNVGETTTDYDLYDSYTGRIRRVQHTETKQVPDLKAFRRYFVTDLIHGTDGNVMDKVVFDILTHYGWALSIHDAILACPETVTPARQLYANQLENIHTNRKLILENFFKSIGIKASAMKEWKETVAPLIEPYNEPFKCNPMVLK